MRNYYQGAKGMIIVYNSSGLWSFWNVNIVKKTDVRKRDIIVNKTYSSSKAKQSPTPIN
jgi:hypothetical protein